MKGILVVEHYPERAQGVLQIAGHGDLSIKLFKPYERGRWPTGLHCSGIILSGGPMSALNTKEFPFLSREQKFLRKVIDRRIPVLGICLGAHVIAHMLGGNVRRMPGKKAGWRQIAVRVHDDPLTHNLPSAFNSFESHEDEIVCLPDCSFLLGSSRECKNEFFRISGTPMWGTQFHPEMDPRLVSRMTDMSSDGIQIHDIVANRRIIENFFAFALRASD